MAYSYDRYEEAHRIIRMSFDDRSGDVELDDHLSIEDIERDIAMFRQDLQILSLSNSDVPALQVGGDLIPVSLNLVMESVLPLARAGYHGWWWDDPGVEFRTGLVRERFEFMSRQAAQETFIDRASSFLADRIAWIRAWRDEPWNHGEPAPMLNIFQSRRRGPVPTPGCLFSVTSDSPGLRVHWSGAYFVARNYFGYPTTPVSSVLQAGHYIFGVDGGAYGNVISWDTNAICRLPGNPSVHLIR